MENVNFNIFKKNFGAEEWIDLRCPGRGNKGTGDPRLATVSLSFPRKGLVNIYCRIGKQLASDVGLNTKDKYCFLFSPNGDKIRLCKSLTGSGLVMKEQVGFCTFKAALSNNVNRILPHASKDLVLVGQDETWVSGGNAITWSLFGKRK